MVFIHPLQSLVSNDAGTLLFFVAKSTIYAFKQEIGQYNLIGKWVDNKAATEAKCSVENSESTCLKKQKGTEGQVVKTADSSASLGAFSLQIRNLTLTPDEKKLISCVDSDKSIVIFEIKTNNKQDNALELIKRQPFPKRPNAIATTSDGDTLVVADKFGDVHQMSIDQNTVHKSDDMQPILGHVSMLTDIIMTRDSNGKKYIITSDRDEHIKISHYPQCFIVDKWLFGHKEFVSSLCCPLWRPNWLFSAGGDDFVFAWDWESGMKLSQFDYSKLIKPYLTDSHLAAERFQNENNDLIEYTASKVLTCHDVPVVAFFVEATKILIILDVSIESGILSLKQTIEFPCNVISLSQSHNDFIVTLDNRDSGDKDFAKFVVYDKNTKNFAVDSARSKAFDDAISSALKEDDSAKVDAAKVFSLYNTISLKKHGEHYS